MQENRTDVKIVFHNFGKNNKFLIVQNIFMYILKML